MTATDELRRLLDERGVEYETDDRNGLRETIWCGVAAFQLSPTAKMTMIITPEQAIAATLGNSRAEQTCRNEWAEFGKFRCSECWTQVDAISTNTTQPMPIKHCPNCGAKVVS